MGDPVRTSATEGRALPRRIDCDDAGAARRAVNPAADLRSVSYAQQAQHARRRLDID
ncbi:MAG TPA: hypothetical protein VE871_16235 [Longimicrobium sp.]|nr:hypothetical protein [Longimicrobium sp.]